MLELTCKDASRLGVRANATSHQKLAAQTAFKYKDSASTALWRYYTRDASKRRLNLVFWRSGA